MITRLIGLAFSLTRDFIARGMIKVGITPNMLTVAGLVPPAIAGYLVARGKFAWALVAIFFIGFFDMLDGAVAKISGKITPFGGVLDSCLDRYGDIFLFCGIAWYFYVEQANAELGIISIVGLLGALLVSYNRARAEKITDKCDVGFWARGERGIYIMIGMATGGLPIVMCIIAAGTHWTAIHRILYALRMSLDPPREITGTLAKILYWTYKRATLPYDIAVGVLTIISIIFGFSLS